MAYFFYQSVAVDILDNVRNTFTVSILLNYRIIRHGQSLFCCGGFLAAVRVYFRFSPLVLPGTPYIILVLRCRFSNTMYYTTVLLHYYHCFYSTNTAVRWLDET